MQLGLCIYHIVKMVVGENLGELVNVVYKFSVACKWCVNQRKEKFIAIRQSFLYKFGGENFDELQ